MSNPLIKVRGFHLDMYGHVNHARYLEFLEEARWALLEQQLDIRWWTDQGLGFAVVNLNVRYRQPAQLGDTLEVRSRMSRLGSSSGVISQEIFLEGTTQQVVTAEVTFVVIDIGKGKPVRLAGDLREALMRVADMTP
jgi:thioesterase-3